MKNIIVTVSSLEKVFPDRELISRQDRYSVFANERFNFQVACFSEAFEGDCAIEINSELRDKITIRRVELNPSCFSQWKGENDDYILLSESDSVLYPDMLRKIRQGAETLRPCKWTSFWITVNDDETVLPDGFFPMEIAVYVGKERRLFGKCTFELTVLPATLEEEDLVYTDWFHYDCIAESHHLEIFSPGYYRVLNEYIDCAVKHGLNMLYTPIFTPPLDTEIGRERRTAQLVSVKVTDGNYRFDFDALTYFIENALDRGIKYIELSHLATQWGGHCCPKIIADVNGEQKKIFGWENRSDSEEYLAFLDAFLAALYAHAEEKGWLDILRFHISDEPGAVDLDRIVTIKNCIVRHFPSAVIMDALHNEEFYLNGINMPVCPTDATETFSKKGILKWIYYCSYQRKNYLSNRFFNMPSQRNRIIGIQMYANDVVGLLHWGFNFYNSMLSKYPIDPYFITDADGAFESGDSFIVYPAEDGVAESLRIKVLAEGFNDYKALKLYERLTDKDRVKRLLEKEGIEGFETYPRSAEWHLSFRLRLNELIMKELKRGDEN